MPDAALDELISVIEFFASCARTTGTERASLICNPAFERAGHDPVSRNFFESYINRISGVIGRALERAGEQGDLRDGINSKQDSRLLSSSLLGCFVLLRSHIEAKSPQSASGAAIAHIKSLQH